MRTVFERDELFKPSGELTTAFAEILDNCLGWNLDKDHIFVTLWDEQGKVYTVIWTPQIKAALAQKWLDPRLLHSPDEICRLKVQESQNKMY